MYVKWLLFNSVLNTDTIKTLFFDAALAPSSQQDRCRLEPSAGTCGSRGKQQEKGTLTGFREDVVEDF